LRASDGKTSAIFSGSSQFGIEISGVSEINSTQKQEDTAEQRNKPEKTDLPVRHLSDMKKGFTPLFWIEKRH
jgi:hypothetical protein